MPKAQKKVTAVCSKFNFCVTAREGADLTYGERPREENGQLLKDFATWQNIFPGAECPDVRRTFEDEAPEFQHHLRGAKRE